MKDNWREMQALVDSAIEALPERQSEKGITIAPARALREILRKHKQWRQMDGDVQQSVEQRLQLARSFLASIADSFNEPLAELAPESEVLWLWLCGSLFVHIQKNALLPGAADVDEQSPVLVTGRLAHAH